ncbi:MAG TPA: carboxypeptidase regulatory-like domain-containing protein, partial [Bryobacteraceae bacterium]|nr:carboxypeptidase regulatory-like domain-containing protein [Bryobacteraceae bacterium]
SNHFTMLSNFTWSHCTSTWDFGGELAGTLYQNPTNRNGERGACSYDHRLNSFTSIVATSGGFGSGLVQQITGGWQLSPIIGLLSGQPLTLTDGGKDISLSGQAQDRPNVVLPGSVYPGTQTVTGWFNQAAFAVQPAGTFGNLGRDAIYGPGTIQFDISLARRFQFHERYRFELRSDFFNILNHGNWNNPGVSIGSPATFGQITAFSSPRQIQLGLKFYF